MTAVEGRNVVVVITYRATEIWPTDATGDTEPTTVTPADPEDRFHHMHHKEGDERGFYPTVPREYWEALAHVLRRADRILLLGHGKGHSNAMLQFVRYLDAHHRDVADRVVGSVETDVTDLTPDQVLALAREYYGETTRVPGEARTRD